VTNLSLVGVDALLHFGHRKSRNLPIVQHSLAEMPDAVFRFYLMKGDVLRGESRPSPAR
jgi:hypothetical protein